jgi:hypothetical protein
VEGFMLGLEPRDTCEVISVEDDAEFRAFVESHPTGLAMIPEKFSEVDRPVLRSDAGDFAKWLKAHHPDVPVEVRNAERLFLRSRDYWLPLVFVATNVGLPVYLNLVSSYLYEKMKGLLRGEKPRVHLSAEYQDPVTGSVKRFNFEGDTDALQDVIKRMNLRQFFDDRGSPD